MEFERFRLLLSGHPKGATESGLGVLRAAARMKAQTLEAVELGVPPALADFRGCRQPLPLSPVDIA